MKIGLKPLGWSLAALLLLLFIPTPLGAVTVFLLMTPFVVLFTTLKPAEFAVHAAAIAAAVFFLGGTGAPLLWMLMIFYMIPAIVMGMFYKRRSNVRAVLLAGFGVILAQLLVELVIFAVVFKMDIAAEISAAVQPSLAALESSGAMGTPGWAEETSKLLGDAMVKMLPMLLIAVSFLFVIITHGLSRYILRKSGMEVPGLPEAKSWQVPRSLIWYYLAALVLSLVLPLEGSGFWGIAVANLLPILQYVFIIQAIGFFFFLADAKKWSKAVPVIISVPLILFPQLYLIGLLDAAFPLRRYIVKS